MRTLWSASAGETYLAYLLTGAIVARIALVAAAGLFDRRLLRRA